MRRVAPLTHWILPAAAVVSIVWSGGIAAATASHHGPSRGVATSSVVHARDALVEEATCWGASAASVPTASGVSVQTITVTVERTALVKVDAAGKVLAAETNTGCAPRPGDRVFVVQADGSLREAVGFDATATAWTGDFTRFGFVPQD
jgi:hypothetical protein